MNGKIEKFMDEKNRLDRSMTEEEVIRTIIERLFHMEELHPHIHRLEFYSGEKSYTINKQQVYLCLRDENGDVYDLNMLMYVTLHELAHCMCKEIGHTPLFYEIFDELLDKAHDHGIYNRNIQPLNQYCEH